MPWEGAAKPADQFPFLAYAPLCKSSPAEGLLLPSVTLRAPGCRVTHRHSLTHTRKRVPRPRPARLCCRPPVPTGVTGGWGQGHGHPPRFGAKCVLWGAPLRPLVQQAQGKCPAAPGGTSGLRESREIISASPHSPLKSPSQHPFAAGTCSFFIPGLLGFPLQTAMSEHWQGRELCCSVLQHLWCLPAAFL